VWCGVVWCGVVWCGVVWCGVVWCGVVWCGVVWCGAVVLWWWLHNACCGVVWWYCGIVAVDYAAMLFGLHTGPNLVVLQAWLPISRWLRNEIDNVAHATDNDANAHAYRLRATLFACRETSRSTYVYGLCISN
jgi:hypothetical protein